MLLHKQTSDQAILYAIRELGRRAGASIDWIAAWRVEIGADRVCVYPEPDSTACIEFPFDRRKPQRFEQLLELPARRYAWMEPPEASLRDLVPTFTVFFDTHIFKEETPLFVLESPVRITCAADLITSTLWTLGRAEEYRDAQRDEHGRFPSAASVLMRDGVLERPIVDEYGLAFAQVLQVLSPRRSLEKPEPRTKLSHDIDLIGVPRSLRTTVGHLYPRRRVDAFLADVRSALGRGPTAYLQAVADLARMSRERGFDSAFYWCANTLETPWDTGYDVLAAPARDTVQSLVDRGFEVGLHPAYGTFENESLLLDEVRRMRSLIGETAFGGRHHYLRWKPATWKAWERAGLAYDSTLGFADALGFRTGTCHPYHPWLFDEDRESSLLEIPLVVMDVTTIAYMQLSPQEALARIDAVAQRSKAVGGVFTLLWHNNNLIDRPYASLYERVLQTLPATRRYDWQSATATALLPVQVPSGAISSRV